MSGGSHGYICYRIEEELCGQMKDEELNDLINDIVKLAHDLEWADSSDTSDENYFESVKEFKKKWFETPRTDRLKNYIDNKIELLKKDLYRLIGIKESEEE